MGRRYQTKAGAGVIVAEVDEGSPAARAGIQVVDVILKSNHRKVNNLDDFIKSYSGKRAANTILVLVDRRGVNLFITIRVN